MKTLRNQGVLLITLMIAHSSTTKDMEITIFNPEEKIIFADNSSPKIATEHIGQAISTPTQKDTIPSYWQRFVDWLKRNVAVDISLKVINDTSDNDFDDDGTFDPFDDDEC